VSTPFDLLVDFAPGAGPFDVIGSHYMLLDATAGTHASTPDTAALDITGDIDVRVDVELDNWLQPGPNGQALAGKWNGSGDQRSWVFWIWAGTLAFSWSTSGANATAVTAPSVALATVPWSSGRRIVRATLDVNNGAGGWTAAFYHGDSMTGPWTLIQQQVTTAGTTSIFSGTANQFVGHIDNPDLAQNAAGKFYKTQIRSSIDGTIVANPDFAAQAIGAGSFADSTGKTWTLNGAAEIAGFDWVDLSDRFLHADWEIGRDDELEDFPAGEATLVFKNDDRQLDPDYTAGTWFGELLPRVPFRLRSVLPALDLPGGGSSGASTPDHADFAIGDLDVTIELSLDDWTPAATAILVGQNGIFSNVGWSISVTTAGLLSLGWSPDGTAASALTRSTTNAPGFVDGTDHTLRVTMDVNDGAGNRVITFYVDGELFETFTTAGTTSIFNSTAALTISIGNTVAGNVRSMILRNAIDGSQIASPDFMIQRPGTTSFVDQTTRTWTITGTAAIAVDTTSPFDEFYGFVDGGWEQDLEPPKLANCTVKLTDRLGVLAGYKLPDVFAHAVAQFEPVGFWVLGGPSGSESVADLSGNGHDGTVVGSVKFGETSVAPGLGTSAEFVSSTVTPPPNPEFGRIEITRSPLVADPSEVSVVAVFRARSKGVLNFRTLFIQHNGTNPGTGFAANVDLTGRPQFAWVLNGGGIGYELTQSVVDGQGHILFGQSDGIAVDSATLSTATTAVATGTPNGVGIAGYPGILEEDHWDGWIGAVAVFDRLLIEQERQVILDGFSMLAGQTSGRHIDWALDRIGVPAEHRNITAGTVVMGPAVAAGQDVVEWIRDVTDTEQGCFYVDHHDGGKLRFTDRYHRFLATRSLGARESFSDSPTSGIAVVRVERGDLDVAPNGTDSIINQVTARWRDGEETVEDPASVAAYGPRPRQIDTEATTAGQARSSAEWLVARYAQPRSRIRGLGIHPGAARRGLRTIRNLQIHDRVSHRLHPQQVGSATITSLFVEGARHEVDDIDWRTRYRLSPVETFTPWIWGESEWDNDTYWG
jgi:hypothetical protein